MTTILLVDDDNEFRSSIKRDLQRQGFDVFVADSVSLALQQLEQVDGVDVVLTDLCMPGEGGLELLRAVARRWPDTSMLLMSAFASARDYQTAMDLGSAQVLNKPFSRADLRSALSRALECRRGFHGTIHGLSLVDILQMFHVARRSACVTLGPDRRIYLSAGEIVHAVAESREGVCALAALLDRDVGHLHTSPLPVRVDATITTPFDRLLLELLQARDERSGRSVASNRVDDSAELDLSALDEPPPARAADGELRQSALEWFAASGVEFVGRDALILAARVSSNHTTVVRGGVAASAYAPELRLVAQAGMRFTSGARRGSYAHLRAGVGVALTWNIDDDLLVGIVESIETESDVGWFRLHASALTRCVGD